MLRKYLFFSLSNSCKYRSGFIPGTLDTFLTKLSNLGCWTKLPLGRESSKGKDGNYRYLFSPLRSNSLPGEASLSLLTGGKLPVIMHLTYALLQSGLKLSHHAINSIPCVQASHGNSTLVKAVLSIAFSVTSPASSGPGHLCYDNPWPSFAVPQHYNLDSDF